MFFLLIQISFVYGIKVYFFQPLFRTGFELNEINILRTFYNSNVSPRVTMVQCTSVKLIIIK